MKSLGWLVFVVSCVSAAVVVYKKLEENNKFDLKELPYELAKRLKELEERTGELELELGNRS